jgi:hypothetical protein
MVEFLAVAEVLQVVLLAAAMVALVQLDKLEQVVLI